ncbi:MAG: hypothetical protein CMJ83_19065 [Planctomycetes bacterium]|nr:hypothetical protein [Planctomycetota bacterium]
MVVRITAASSVMERDAEDLQGMRLPRGIFVKLVTVFLVIGLLPFIGLSVWTYEKASSQMTSTVIEYWLVRQARETAAHLDREVDGMRNIIQSWADDPLLAEHMTTAANESVLKNFLERRRNYRWDLDLLMIVRTDGFILAESTVDSVDPLDGKYLNKILPNVDDREWIELGLKAPAGAETRPEVPVSAQDWHRSALIARARSEPPPEGYPEDASAYAIGFAATILDRDNRRPLGALVGLFSWKRIQGALDRVTTRFTDPDDPRRKGSRYPSGYPFLFADGRDTIIAHKVPSLLGTSLEHDHDLGLFRDQMSKAAYGSYKYEYPPGTRKISGYAHCRAKSDGGFSWTVGVGINGGEIYADVDTLRDFMIIAALIVTGLVILLAAVFSHRITEPITRLIAYTETVARGNLDTRVDIHTNDEIAVLADSFNKMAEDLKESNQRLIKAEKDAAWREMARQVAHEIKNPLTPIMLSAQQLRKAHEDRHAAFDEILSDSVDTIVDQCEGLRRIASDFAAFASFPKRNLKPHDLAELVETAVGVYQPRVQTDVSVSCGIRTPKGLKVVIDKDEFRRVFLNLFNNAMEAMEDGGRLDVRTVLAPDGRVRIEVKDTGCGIPAEDHHRLFEPYFSTRTGGTGLGLAICKRIIQEHNGTIEVESEIGSGTTFVISLPQAETQPT